MTVARAAAKQVGTDADASPVKTRKRDVICAGAALFQQKGYSGASMGSIADVVGIHKSTLYNYVASKEELLETIITAVDEDGLETLRIVGVAGGTALQRLRLYVVVSLARNTERRAESSVYLQEYRELSSIRRRAVIEKRDCYDAFLSGLLREGQKEGSIRSDIDSRLTTIMIHTLLSSAHQWLNPRGPLEPKELAQVHADMIVAGVSAV